MFLGLFHKAIGQSGSALNLWATPKPSYAIAKIQGTFSNCQSNKTNELVDCLRKADASALLDSGDKFKVKLSRRGVILLILISGCTF